ncbi:MAG: hypothetical protein J5842_07105, partial [Lachnospiraceae bacterium]|nr:hypothetical protein [Lachnospiraceae bacterium]
MGWTSRQEKRRILELDSTGIAIEEVYGSKRTSSFFLCLSKALIIFLVCSGTITGFCDAFSLNYNKGLVVFFIAVISLMVSMLYVNKKLFYIGYVVLLVFFTIELLRYYLYANSGFQAITNAVRKAYGDHFGSEENPLEIVSGGKFGVRGIDGNGNETDPYLWIYAAVPEGDLEISDIILYAD